MTLARAFVLAVWASVVVLMSQLVSSVAATLLVMEGRAAASVVPWFCAAVAVGASGVGAFLARLFPSVGGTYSWPRITLAGVAGWPIAWWTGLEVGRGLERATPAGVFALNVTLEHAAFWNGVVALVALLVLLVPWGAPRPPIVAGRNSSGV